jgi:hypothetical protein
LSPTACQHRGSESSSRREFADVAGVLFCFIAGGASRLHDEMLPVFSTAHSKSREKSTAKINPFSIAIPALHWRDEVCR